MEVPGAVLTLKSQQQLTRYSAWIFAYLTWFSMWNYIFFFSGSCWNSTEGNMQMSKCNSVLVMAAVEALHTRPSLAHVNHCSDLCTSGAAAWLQSKADWTSPGPLCANMHWANRNNIISLRLLWCVFSDPPVERCGHIERSAICSVEWIQECVCLFCQSKEKSVRKLEEKNQRQAIYTHPYL